MATVEGARTAHLDAKIGTLTPGKEADILTLVIDRINVFPMNNVPGTIVTLMDTSNVENVFIAGRVMKWQGKRRRLAPDPRDDRAGFRRRPGACTLSS
jgi:cytosine/adenosine deaminase-related metal-dependent hydrolase